MKRMTLPRRTLLGAFCVLPVMALTTDLVRAQEADQPIQILNAGLLAIMRAGKATPITRRFDQFAPVIDRVFDLDSILQGATGPAWAGLLSADREDLRAEFRRFTIASWVANFDNFAGEVFRVKPDIRSLGAAGQVVDTEFSAPGADVVKLSYVLRARSDGWRVVDVLADGTISHVAVLRSDFRRVLAEGGAPALSAQLRQKSVGLLAG